MKPTQLLPLACFVILACPSAEAPAPDASKQADEQSGAKADATKPDATKPDATKPDAAKPDAAKPSDSTTKKRAEAKAKFTVDEAELHDRRRQMLASLNEGRKLVKDGDLTGGVGKYKELLKIDPHYGPALGELGWAEFKSNAFDDAHAHTLLALSLADEDKQRGMLLYNLGRIAEARGQTSDAIDHYQASLQARPNDTVAARLADLQAGSDAGPGLAGSAGGDPSQLPQHHGLKVVGTGLGDIAAMCEAAARDSFCSGESCEMIATPNGDSSWGTLHANEDWAMTCWHPAMQTASGWVVFANAAFAQYGSEIDQNVDAIASRVVRNDAGEFLLIEYADHQYERVWGDDLEDEEIPDNEMIDSEGVIICRRDTPACTQALTVKWELMGEASYQASLTLDGDVVVISDVKIVGVVDDLGGTEADWSSWIMLPEGRYPLATLTASSK